MVSQATPNRWIAYRKPRTYPRVRLFCFPYAGGGAGIYRTWQNDLPEQVEVCAVQLPGREGRLKDPAFTRMDPLVTAAAEALTPLLDGLPFAFFGHSMGAAIAYELARLLDQQGRATPVHLLASARRASGLPRRKDPTYHLPDDELKEELRQLQGTPQSILDHPELMDLMLPLLRADFELIETYQPTEDEAPPLDCPVTAFGGHGDEDVPREDLEAWGRLTNAGFRLRMFPGDHFFLQAQQASLAGAVAEELRSYLV